MHTVYGYIRTDKPKTGEYSFHPLSGTATANQHSDFVCAVSFGESLPIETLKEAVEEVKARLAEKGVAEISEVYDAVP